MSNRKSNEFKNSLKHTGEDEGLSDLEEHFKETNPKELQEFVDKKIEDYISEFLVNTSQHTDRVANLTEHYALHLNFFGENCIKNKISKKFYIIGELTGAYESMNRIASKKANSKNISSEDEHQKPHDGLINSNSTEKIEDWNIEERIKESTPEELQKFVQLKIDNYISAFVRNNPNGMEQLLYNSEFNLKSFKEIYIKSQTSKKYFTLGRLKGATSLVSGILSRNVIRDAALRRFKNNILESFPWATDIIQHIGNLGNVDEKEVIEKFQESRNVSEIKEALYRMRACSFINYYDIGNNCNLSLSDSGKWVFNHYNKQPEEEIYFTH